MLLVGCLRGLDDDSWVDPVCPTPDCAAEGLRFESSRTVEGYVETHVAAGGRTTWRVSAPRGSSLAEIAVEVDEGFEVLAVESTERSATVELRATREAAGELRVLDEGGLLGAIPLVSRERVRTRVLPVVGLGPRREVARTTLELGTWTLWHEVEHLTVAFASYDADDERLVDLDLAKSSNAPEPEGAPQSGWDSMALDVRGVEWLALEAGGRRVTIPRETRVDGIARVPHPFLTCFVATHAGVPVVGVPLTVSSDGGAPEAAGGPREGWPYLDAPCAVRGGTVVVEGAGIRRTFVVD
ncbi:MAG: hypothetical protein H6721_14570 [Sandaracinus sp.]|nr:hypothetical protein [Sandaracinus sp.]MCB9633340.1 hypothetical protein [Sandaracinus sp.]